MECQRCGIDNTAHYYSAFNSDVICVTCRGLEIAHPDYQKARDAELDSIKNGNWGFPGIGLPDDLKR